MLLSVIIVNYIVRPFLKNALLSVTKALEGIPAEIIVVDNASDDGSIEMVQQEFPNVILIANSKNIGFGSANNLAMSRAQGKYFLLINPDSIVQENTIRVMIDFFEHHQDVGMAGCKVLNPDGSLQLACRRSFPTPWIAFTKMIGLSKLFPRTKIFGSYNLTYLDPDIPHEVDAISGSFMFLRRTVYEKVGGFDEQYFMYGEDLDWCYRVQKAGWKIFYLPTTQIIHYKGQSVKRSDIDDVKVFYQAMRLFVKKNLKSSIVMDLILQIGIAFRQWIAFLNKIGKQLIAAIFDFLMVIFAWLCAEIIRFGEIFHLPEHAYPITLTVPGIIVIGSLFSVGVYTHRKLSISQSIYGVSIAYILLSALTFYFKDYGFSRMVVIIAGIINLISIPAWRFIAILLSKSPEFHYPLIWGRKTVIVGIQESGLQLLNKLRSRLRDGYNVVGFIDLNRKRIGEKIAGVEILGSIENIGKVIREQKISEVIFASDKQLSYTEILHVIKTCNNRSVNFRLVPSNLEVIIGKTHIDQLNDIPLVDIEYNLYRPWNRLFKRLFDIVGSFVLLCTIYPIIWLKIKLKKDVTPFSKSLLHLPKVLTGKLSLVGIPLSNSENFANKNIHNEKQGLTGLIQLNYREDITPEEIETYNLFYTQNQSLILDIEILLKSFSSLIRK